MATIEYIASEPKEIEMHNLGRMKKGVALPCSAEIAEEFKKDKRFKVVTDKKGGSK